MDFKGVTIIDLNLRPTLVRWVKPLPPKGEKKAKQDIGG